MICVTVGEHVIYRFCKKAVGEVVVGQGYRLALCCTDDQFPFIKLVCLEVSWQLPGKSFKHPNLNAASCHVQQADRMSLAKDTKDLVPS